VKKRIFIIVTLLLNIMLIASVSLASPLTDYSPGKTAIDLNWFPNGTLDGSWGSVDGKRGNIDWGVTTGLGNKFALQYRQFNPESKDIGVPSYRFGMRTQEVNVLYQLNKNVSAFVGWHQAKLHSSGITASDRNTFQAGLVGNTKIAPKTTLYGVVGVGSNLVNTETGVAYEVGKDLDLNVFYRYKKIDKLEYNISGETYKDDLKFKGVGVGLTYKF
jgi:predicted porin